MLKNNKPKLLYINDELITSDGSNYHAIGMLDGFRQILGEENVLSFPKAQDGSSKPFVNAKSKVREKFKNPLQYIRYVRKKYRSCSQSRYMIKWLKGQNFCPDYIVARSTIFDTTAVKVAKKTGAKLIYEINAPMYYERCVIRQEPLRKAVEKWELEIINESALVYINSNIGKEMLCSHYGVEPDKFCVIPNGFMKELYSEDFVGKKEIRDRIRKEENYENKKVVVFVGSLKPWHGIKIFCRVASLLEKNDDYRFVIIGDGELHDLVVKSAEKHSNIVFKGKMDLQAMKEYLYACDLGIMPYDNSQNFYYSPLKMFDMIGAGLPFIGTAVGQIEEFCNENLDDRFLCHTPTAKEYKKRILQIMNSSDIVEMTAEVEKIRERNTWTERAEELVNNMRTGKVGYDRI